MPETRSNRSTVAVPETANEMLPLKSSPEPEMLAQFERLGAGALSRELERQRGSQSDAADPDELGAGNRCLEPVPGAAVAVVGAQGGELNCPADELEADAAGADEDVGRRER